MAQAATPSQQPGQQPAQPQQQQQGQQPAAPQQQGTTFRDWAAI